MRVKAVHSFKLGSAKSSHVLIWVGEDAKGRAGMCC